MTDELTDKVGVSQEVLGVVSNLALHIYRKYNKLKRGPRIGDPSDSLVVSGSFRLRLGPRTEQNQDAVERSEGATASHQHPVEAIGVVGGGAPLSERVHDHPDEDGRGGVQQELVEFVLHSFFSLELRQAAQSRMVITIILFLL